jgi:hypothetical protein
MKGVRGEPGTDDPRVVRIGLRSEANSPIECLESCVCPSPLRRSPRPSFLIPKRSFVAYDGARGPSSACSEFVRNLRRSKFFE